MAAKKKSQPKATQRFRPNESKFRELMLFIARRSEGDPHFGAIKLNKLLFYSDFLAYLKLGQPITGQEYFALENGPAPRYMVPIREKMIASREIAVQKKETYSGLQARTIALREADLSNFTPQEIDLVTNLISECKGRSGGELSELSHKFSGWSLAGDKQTIPYSVALVGKRPPTREEIRQGVKLESTAAACLTEHAG